MIVLESEVKFFLSDPAALGRRLREAGATVRGEAFETNYRFDNADRRLQAAHCLLRLRRDGRNRLTFKRPDPSGGRQFKTHEEIEVEVSDFETTAELLEALGFRRIQIYEKRRATFELHSAEICLDQLPFGHFVEIEGAPEVIPSLAETLGLQWPRRILANYLEIFERLRRRLELPFIDVTFANFEGVQADLAPLIRGFEMERVR
jgi:adenylate cyclase class 2